MTTIGMIGQFREGKRFDHFLSALAKANRISRVPINGLLVGDGCDMERMQRLAQKLGIANRVEFTGHVPDTRSCLTRMDALFLVTDREGLPNALLEGGAMGLPLAATAVGGVPEIIEDGVNGFLFSPGDIEGISSAIVRLAENSRLRRKMGAAARERTVESFSIRSMKTRYENLYHRLLMGDSRCRE